MKHIRKFSPKSLVGFSRSPVEQARTNLQQALRVLDMIPLQSSELIPHPLVVLRVEIENARRYLAIELDSGQGSAA